MSFKGPDEKRTEVSGKCPQAILWSSDWPSSKPAEAGWLGLRPRGSAELGAVGTQGG